MIKLCDIDIFEADGWDELDIGFLQYYDCIFKLPELVQFNHMDCAMGINGLMEITKPVGEPDEQGAMSVETVFSNNVASIQSFRDQLNEKWGAMNNSK